MAVSTPWGASQHSTQILRGAVFHTTAGHGGVHIAEQLAGRVLSKFVRNRGIKDGSGYWYEEDCDISLPMYELMKAGYADKICKFFCNQDSEKLMKSIADSISRWNPEYFNDSHERYSAIPCYERLAKDWVVCFNDGRKFKVVCHEKSDCIVSYCNQIFTMPKRVYFRGVEEVFDENGNSVWSEK